MTKITRVNLETKERTEATVKDIIDIYSFLSDVDIIEYIRQKGPIKDIE